MDLPDGAAGNFSATDMATATVTDCSDDIRNEEFDDLHADPLQVDEHKDSGKDSGAPYQN